MSYKCYSSNVMLGIIKKKIKKKIRKPIIDNGSIINHNNNNK